MRDEGQGWAWVEGWGEGVRTVLWEESLTRTRRQRPAAGRRGVRGLPGPLAAGLGQDREPPRARLRVWLSRNPEAPKEGKKYG